MTKTTAPKAPRLTKAQKLAKIELETQAIEREIAQEKGLEYVAPVGANPETLELAQEAKEPSPLDLGQAMMNMVCTKTIKVVHTKKTGVGQQILLLIAQGELSNKEIVTKVLEDNPERKTTYACVAWYQSQVRAGKIDLPRLEVTEE